jgi:hypothetical protein
MALFSASGGSVTVNGTPDVTIHVSEWSIQKGARQGDGSTSAQGYSVFVPCLEDNTASFSLPEDNANTLEDAGIVKGAMGLDLYFRHGASAVYTRLQNTTVSSIGENNNNQGDLYRVQVQLQGGVVTEYSAAPS